MRIVALLVLLLCLGSTPAAAKPPAWDTVAAGSKRFRVLSQFGGEAVLDAETGLVWSRGWLGVSGWAGSLQHCLRRSIGGRMGWRMPLAHEMTTLIDPATGFFPAGHPFDVQPGAYWTGTTAEVMAGTKDYAYVVRNDGSALADILEVEAKTTSGPYVLCVRGPGGTDNL